MPRRVRGRFDDGSAAAEYGRDGDDGHGRGLVGGRAFAARLVAGQNRIVAQRRVAHGVAVQRHAYRLTHGIAVERHAHRFAVGLAIHRFTLERFSHGFDRFSGRFSRRVAQDFADHLTGRHVFPLDRVARGLPHGRAQLLSRGVAGLFFPRRLVFPLRREGFRAPRELAERHAGLVPFAFLERALAVGRERGSEGG
jgi:hypothetical protein